MKNLTEKQQTIIADITNEFVKINEEKSKRKKGSLIDIDALLFERNRDLELKKNIELMNRINSDKFNQRINDDVIKLNEDLVDFNLVAKQEENYIIIDEPCRPKSKVNNSIYIKYRKEHIYKTFKSQIEGIYLITDEFSIEGTNNIYASIEEYIKESNFNGSLRTLINTTINN
jgi:hypothetical protein